MALTEELGLEHYHVVRAALLRRLGRFTEAARAYERAAARTGNTAERDYLLRARDALGPELQPRLAPGVPPERRQVRVEQLDEHVR